MRKILGLAGTVAITLVLSGCNPPPLRAPQQQACNCNGSVETSNPGAETPRFTPPGDNAVRHRYASHRSYRRHHDYTGAYRYREHDSYSYTRTASYDYHASSRSYYQSSRSSAYAYAGSAAYASTTGSQGGFVQVPSQTDTGWQDGYSRYHRGSAATGRELSARMDPWRGYDVDCPNLERHHGGHY